MPLELEPSFLYCPCCASECLTETPPCADDHGGDACPDRACVECGTALLLDTLPVQLAAVRPGGAPAGRDVRRRAA